MKDKKDLQISMALEAARDAVERSRPWARSTGDRAARLPETLTELEKLGLERTEMERRQLLKEQAEFLRAKG